MCGRRLGHAVRIGAVPALLGGLVAEPARAEMLVHHDLPYAAVLPIAYAAEIAARVTGRPGRVTLEGVRMSRKRMFFSSAKAVRDLGYRWRPPAEAFTDAVRWFRERGSL